MANGQTRLRSGLQADAENPLQNASFLWDNSDWVHHNLRVDSTHRSLKQAFSDHHQTLDVMAAEKMLQMRPVLTHVHTLLEQRLASERNMLTKIAAVSVAALLTACASPIFDVGRSETVLPVSRAWVDGQIVEYVTTDISDLDMARMMGSNHAPRLADAVRSPSGQSLVERVYKFPNEEQISVFQSAPNPVGADNQDKNYSPLWQVVNVRWKKSATVRELKSEEAVLAAHERNEVELEKTHVVVNCPVTRSATGHKLKGVR